MSHKDMSLEKNGVRWFVAELLGTFVLALTVGVSVGSISGSYPGYQALYLPAVIGLVVALLVYLFGAISGAHFNPAVTVSLLVIRKIKATHAIVNLIGQVAGAYLGLMVAQQMVGEFTSVPSAGDRAALFGELVGAFILVFTVTRVVQGKISEAMSGLVIGTSLVIGLTLSMGVSGGVLNPAIALGLHSYHVAYLIAPFVGGLLGVGLAWWFGEN